MCDFLYVSDYESNITDITEVGVRQAVCVVREQTSNLQFCRHCLEVMHRSKNSAAPQSDRHSHAHTHSEDRNSDPLRAGDIPENTERINSVTEYMKTYSFSDEVQIVGLDAIIVYARSGEPIVMTTDMTLQRVPLTFDAFHSSSPFSHQYSLIILGFKSTSYIEHRLHLFI